MKNENKSTFISVKERRPLVREAVIVVCEQFRCLGFLDEHGVWRHDKDGAEIQGVIGWRPLAG